MATTLECIIWGWFAAVMLIAMAGCAVGEWLIARRDRQPFSDEERAIPPVPWR